MNHVNGKEPVTEPLKWFAGKDFVNPIAAIGTRKYNKWKEGYNNKIRQVKMHGHKSSGCKPDHCPAIS